MVQIIQAPTQRQNALNEQFGQFATNFAGAYVDGQKTQRQQALQEEARQQSHGLALIKAAGDYAESTGKAVTPQDIQLLMKEISAAPAQPIQTSQRSAPALASSQASDDQIVNGLDYGMISGQSNKVSADSGLGNTFKRQDISIPMKPESFQEREAAAPLTAKHQLKMQQLTNAQGQETQRERQFQQQQVANERATKAQELAEKRFIRSEEEARRRNEIADKKEKILEDGKQMTAANVSSFNEGNQIPTMLTDIRKVIEANSEAFGPIAGRFKSLNPYSELGQTMESQLRASSQAFGKFMEGGVLRKEDEEKYKKMFPQLSDLPQVAKDKLAIVNRLLVERQKSLVEALRNSGYNVNGIEKTMKGSELPSVLNVKDSGEISQIDQKKISDILKSRALNNAN